MLARRALNPNLRFKKRSLSRWQRFGRRRSGEDREDFMDELDDEEI
jgi:hypothetical protein